MLFLNSSTHPNPSRNGSLQPVLLACAFLVMIGMGIGIGWLYERSRGPKWTETAVAAAGTTTPAAGAPTLGAMALASKPNPKSPATPEPTVEPAPTTHPAASQRSLPDPEPAPAPDWTANDIPAVPFIPLLGEGRETQKLMQPQKQKARSINEVYDLSVYTNSTVQPPATLILMPDTPSIDLVADVVMNRLLPDGYQEQRISVEWATADGRIEADSSQLTRSSRARFFPARRNQPATITLTLEVGFDPHALESQPNILRMEKTIRVLVPISSRLMVNGIIDGYNIGEYLDTSNTTVRNRFRVKTDYPFVHPDRYQPPTHYYRITRDLKPLDIAPHVDLSLFVIDFPWKSLGMPQYVAIDPNLVRKLEDLITLMQADGINIDHFTPIYGFRPPSFNLSTIADHPDTNLKEPFSMHQYGRAVDVIVDMDGDGLMDDLNGDGVRDMNDPAVVMHYVNIVDRRYREEGRMEMLGGAGLYHEHDFIERLNVYEQTPYIHIDTRGYLRDDQTLIRWPYAWPNGDPIRWGDI